MGCFAWVLHQMIEIALGLDVAFADAFAIHTDVPFLFHYCVQKTDVNPTDHD